MSKGTAIDLGLNEAYNDLFSTQEERDNAQRSYVIDLPATEISDFPDHPFKVRMDEEMEQMVESVRERGVLSPVLVLSTICSISSSIRTLNGWSGKSLISVAGKSIT